MRRITNTSFALVLALAAFVRGAAATAWPCSARSSTT